MVDVHGFERSTAIRAFLILGGLAFGWLAPAVLSAEEITRIHLKPEATVGRDVVYLKDVGDIESADATLVESLNRVALPVADKPGSRETLDLPAVKQALTSAGFHLGTLQFSGAYRTSLLREEAPPAPEKKPLGDWEKVVYDVLKKNIHAQLAAGEAELVVEIAGRRAIEFLNEQNPESWELALPESWTVGTQTVTLTAPTSAGPARFPVQVTIHRRRPVVVATKRIPRGVTVDDDAVQLVSQTVETDNADYTTSLDQVVGKQASRIIEPNQIVSASDVASKPMVFRGSRMTVLIRYRTASLEMNAIAGEDGGLGELIEVINPETKKPLQQKAKVVGLQTAVLLDGVEPESTKPGEQETPK